MNQLDRAQSSEQMNNSIMFNTRTINYDSSIISSNLSKEHSKNGNDVTILASSPTAAYNDDLSFLADQTAIDLKDKLEDC